MIVLGPLTIVWEPRAAWVYYEFWFEDAVQFQFGKLLVRWEFVIK